MHIIFTFISFHNFAYVTSPCLFLLANQSQAIPLLQYCPATCSIRCFSSRCGHWLLTFGALNGIRCTLAAAFIYRWQRRTAFINSRSVLNGTGSVYKCVVVFYCVFYSFTFYGHQAASNCNYQLIITKRVKTKAKITCPCIIIGQLSKYSNRSINKSLEDHHHHDHITSSDPKT